MTSAKSKKTSLLEHSVLVSQFMSEMIPDFKNGILHRLMNQSALWNDSTFTGFLFHFLGIEAGEFPLPKTLSPEEVAELLKVSCFFEVTIKIEMKFRFQ
jgi:hypothetical protein